MENLNLELLSGGYYKCTPEWNSDTYGKDNCYKIYFPVEGNAKLFINGEWHTVTAGNIYYINGFMLDKYCCDNCMKVYWLHFLPESQLVSMYFNNLEPVYCWEKGNVFEQTIDYKRIPQLFDNPQLKDNEPLGADLLSLKCYINSVLLMLISDMIASQNADVYRASNDLYLKLKPSVEFINSNFRQNLKLDEIAQKAFLNPIYFLRLFKRCFKMTPTGYINMLRLNEACRLLTNTDMSILDISEKTGFCNQFYFSKVFKSHFRRTPVEYRRKQLLP